MSHYQRLGVTPAASTEELRQAYLGLAKRLHPDTLTGASPAERELAERRMREVNEAWHVLSDPARRRAYDLERAGGRAASTADRPRTRATAPVPAIEDDHDDLGPPVPGFVRHGPWILLVIVFALIFVLTAYAARGKDDPGQTPRTTVGSCVDVSPGPTVVDVPCSGAHDLRIVVRVDEATACPAGTERRRLQADGLLDCVVAS